MANIQQMLPTYVHRKTAKQAGKLKKHSEHGLLENSPSPSKLHLFKEF